MAEEKLLTAQATAGTETHVHCFDTAVDYFGTLGGRDISSIACACGQVRRIDRFAEHVCVFDSDEYGVCRGWADCAVNCLYCKCGNYKFFQVDI